MDKHIFNKKENETLAALLAGELKAQHKQKFMESLDSKQLEALGNTQMLWQSMQNPFSTQKPDTNAAWEKISNRIVSQEKLMDTHSSGHNPLLPQWAKWAAGWLLIVALTFSAFWLLSPGNPQEQLVTLNTSGENITHVHTLKDGSVIYLASYTSVSFAETFSVNERKLKLAGEAFFDVVQKQGQPFIVETPNARIEVLGTSFNIKNLQENSFELFVETGKVSVTTLGITSKDYIVESGEILRMINGSVTKAFAEQDYNTAWRKNHMHFKDESLQNILKVLNQNHPVNFIAEDPILNARRLTLTFYNTSAPTMAQLIALSLNVDFEQKDDTTFVLKPRI